MRREELLKNALNYLSNKNSDAVIEFLTREDKLNNDEKNLLYFYLFPRKLLDRELPNRIIEYRKFCNMTNGFLIPNTGETALLIEAYKTEQYYRFMRHLMHSFIRSEDNVSPIKGNTTCNCCLCNKTLYNYDLWENLCKTHPEYNEQNKKEFLTFGSKESDVNLCLDCLIQLKNADEILKILEPNYI